MKKKAIRKNKVTRLRKQTVLRKPIRKKAAARKRKPIRKAAVKPEKISSKAGAPGSLPEVTDTDREATVDMIEVFEVGVSSTQDGLPDTDEAEVVPEETEEEVV